MKSIVVSTDHLYSFKNFNTQLKENSDLKIYSEIFKLVPFTWLVDRTESCSLPFATHFKEEYRIPLVQQFNDSLEEICQSTVEKYKNINKQIYILWSGGIDSTLLVISFLKSSIDKENIIVACNIDSVRENYNFYKKYILPNFKVISSDIMMQNGNLSVFDGLILNGDPADVLYGYDLASDILKILGPNYLQLPCDRENVINYFNLKGLSNNSANFWYDYFKSTTNKSYKPIITMQDFSWWEGFNYRWQAANEKLKIRLSSESSKNYKQFFNTTEFQLWSIHRQFSPIKQFSDFKKESKRIIFDYTKDEFYYRHKIKLNSNTHIFGLNSYSALLNGDQRLTSKEFNIFDFYNQNNFINDWLSI